MNIHINEMNSTVRAVDSQALLNPQVLEQIIRLVLTRLREENERQQRSEADRQLRSGVAEDPLQGPWS